MKFKYFFYQMLVGVFSFFVAIKLMVLPNMPWSHVFYLCLFVLLPSTLVFCVFIHEQAFKYVSDWWAKVKERFIWFRYEHKYLYKLFKKIYFESNASAIVFMEPDQIGKFLEGKEFSIKLCKIRGHDYTILSAIKVASARITEVDIMIAKAEFDGEVSFKTGTDYQSEKLSNL